MRPSLLLMLVALPGLLGCDSARRVREAEPESGTTIRELIETVQDEHVEYAAQAARALGRMGAEANSAVPVLVDAFNAGRGDLPWHASLALTEIAPGEPEVIDAFVEGLRDGDDNRRIWSARALARIGPEAKKATPLLVAATEDRLAGSFAIDALGAIGPAARAAVPALLEVCADGRPGDRGRAVRALGLIDASDRSVVPALLGALEDGDWLVRYRAVFALENVTPVTEEILNALEQARSDDDRRVAQAAGGGLRRARGTRARPGE